jgi:hypothetical protein
MEEVNLILAGSTVIHGLLLLLFQPTEESMNDTVQKEFDGFMKLREGTSTSHRTKEIIQFIADDKFDEGVYKDSLNWTYLSTLKNLKEEFVTFYFKKLKDLENENLDMDSIADLDARISEYVIQLMRLRLVIQPDVKISTNVHPRTTHPYLAVKAYWIDESGKKVRKFTKSIGRAENYPQGRKDPKALADGIKLVQPVLFETYKELYTE